MRPVSEELRLPVTPMSAPRRAPPVIQRQSTFAWWMAAGALTAVVAGLVLGILAATEASIGGERWTPSVQAHGKLQLFAFVATFVTALVLEFAPRLNQRSALPASVRLGIPAAFAVGGALLGAGQAWDAEAGMLAWPGAALVITGAVAFAVVLWRVPPPIPLRASPQPLFLRAGAAWLAISAVLTAWAVAEGEAGVVPLELARTIAETFLRGFVMLTIVGIGLRAFVGHLNLQPVSGRRQWMVFAGLNASLVVWVSGQGLGRMPEWEWLARIGDAGTAGTILAATAWFGLLPKLWRGRRGSKYELLIPVAWAGVVVYAAMLLVAAIVAGPRDLSLYESGAIRHVLMLGFMVPLMVAMAHVVLARFGAGFVPWEPALTAAFWVLVAAWPLRVIPALLDEAPSSASQGVMGLAGVLAMVGLALAAAVSARTAALIAERQRAAAMRHGAPAAVQR